MHLLWLGSRGRQWLILLKSFKEELAMTQPLFIPLFGIYLVSSWSCVQCNSKGSILMGGGQSVVSPSCLCKELSIYLMWRLSFRKPNLPHPIGSFLPSVLVIKLAKVRQRDTRSTDSIWATTVQGQGHGCPTSAVTQDPATWRAYRRLNALLLSSWNSWFLNKRSTF